MRALRILHMAADAGVNVTLDASGGLTLDAASEPPAHIIDLLREHKAELVELLADHKPRTHEVLYRRFGDTVLCPHRRGCVPGGLADLFAAAAWLDDEGFGPVAVIQAHNGD